MGENTGNGGRGARGSGVVRDLPDLIMRIPKLLLGLFLFSVGILMSLYSNLGMSPWGVFQIGLTKYLPLTLGQVSQLVGLVVLVLGWALGFPPGLGTVSNMYFVGLFIDLVISWNLLPRPTETLGQFAMLVGGDVVLGIASLLYLGVQLGAGPRDGLMVGLVTKLDRPVSHVRLAIESSVLIMGFLLGGPVGIGTVVNAVIVGPVIQQCFRLGGFNPKSEQVDLYRLMRILNGKG